MLNTATAWKVVFYKAISWNLCKIWIHIKCNKLIDLDYKYLKLNQNAWYCKICTTEILIFCKTFKDSNKSDIDKRLSNNLKVNLKTFSSNLTNDEKDENKCFPNSKYKDRESFSIHSNNMKSKCLSMLR